MKQQTLYLDMDGVVADWTAGAARIIGYRLEDPSAYYPQEDWIKIQQNDRQFLELPKMRHADELVRIARQFRNELNWKLMFLTAIPHNNDMPWAFYDKVKWAEQYYPDIPVMFGPYSKDKSKHCQPGDILVDDRVDNCAEWREAGGVAVHVVGASFMTAVKELETIFTKKQSLNRIGNIASMY